MSVSERPHQGVEGKPYDEVDMSWSVRMTIHQVKKLASWSIVWHGVRGRSQAVKGIFSLSVGQEFAAKVVFDLLVVLLFVETWKIPLASFHLLKHSISVELTIRASLPDVHDGV